MSILSMKVFAFVTIVLIMMAGCSKDCTTCNKRVYQSVNHGPLTLIWQDAETPDAAIKLCGEERRTERTLDTSYNSGNLVIRETQLVCNH